MGKIRFGGGSSEALAFGRDRPWGELLAGAVVARAVMGSFDCVVVRFADDNFAQDDRGFLVDQGFGRGAGEISQTRSAAAGPKETLPLVVERVRVWS
jgi:hypothetical protein